jgi:hypothetical protein
VSRSFLPEEPRRAALQRMDTARTLKRFLHMERALIVACGAWVPAVRRLDTKELLARVAWENALTAQALRERVFELRYPDRSLELGPDRPLVALFEAALHAPGGGALLRGLSDVLVGWQLSAYDGYLKASDDVADGPTRRFLELAAGDKLRQQRALHAAAETELSLESSAGSAATEWSANLALLLKRLGPGALEPPRADVDVPDVVAPGATFELAQDPGRDDRYFRCSFYWPDIVDPGWDYGRGLQLQLRSAVSHLNEVWAVETAGAILHGLADLGWDFVHDAARWLYDESRHMAMGKRRLEWWGLPASDVPLGSYIYDACKGQDAVQRLGMLAFFETRNIGKKRERADELGRLGDRTSQRDMDFDWADEAIHAGYGRRWLRAALESAGRDPGTWPEVVERCESLVARRVARATPAEVAAIKARAGDLIRRAESIARASGGDPPTEALDLGVDEARGFPSP